MSHDPMSILADAIVLGGVIAALLLAGAAVVAVMFWGFGIY